MASRSGIGVYVGFRLFGVVCWLDNPEARSGFRVQGSTPPPPPPPLNGQTEEGDTPENL